MDLPGYLSVLVYLGALALAFVVAKRYLFKRDKSGRKYAPSVGCLPIIGSFPYLPAACDLHTWSLKKSAELGPVFSMTVGKIYTVILNDEKSIREALIQKPKDFPGRIDHFGNRILNPNAKGIIFHQYNEDFKKYHQLTLSILRDLGLGKNSMETRICAEIDLVIKKIIAYNGESFYPKDMLECGTYNVISRMVFAKPLDESSQRDKRLLHRLGTFANQVNELLPMDIVPSLRFLPYFKKKIEIARMHTIELMNLVDQKIKETLNSPLDESFVSYYLEKEGENIDREQLRYTVRDLIFAGSETVSTSAQWMLLLLANYQDVQKRLQSEIDSVVPRDRFPSITDMKSLVYVEAAILELMRYKTVTPMGLSHLTLEDSEVGGYFIPKSTIIWTMLYAAHMDERTWGDPTVFRPERFLGADGNIINRDLVIPFAIGKRSCIGETMARQEVFLYFTCFLQKFHILPPEGENRISEVERPDMILGPHPFKVRCLLRKEI